VSFFWKQSEYNYKAADKRQRAMIGQTRQGVLLLADISGYTSLLASTELEKASKIIQYLIERIYNATSLPFMVNEIEGDALYIFTVHEGQGKEALFIQSLKQLEAYADVFYHAMEELSWSNLKDDAMFRKLLSEVSLKFVVHYGTFKIVQTGSFVKLVGADGILAHRLLKNSVDSDSYFLFTRAFLDLDEDMAHAKAMTHVEEIQYFGTVDVGVRTFDYDEEHERRHGQEHDHLTRRQGIII